MSIDFILPDIGEGIVECELVEWLVAEGDMIEEDQPIADVMTDKALVQIPAMHQGKITKLYYQQGDIAKVHQPLFAIEVADSTAAENSESNSTNKEDVAESNTQPTSVVQESKSSITPSNSHVSNNKALASPAVRRVARELDINIVQIPGSGKNGRVLKDDVLNFKENSQGSLPVEQKAVNVTPQTSGNRVEPIRGVKAAMAKAMTASVSTIPHFTYCEEIDLTSLIQLRTELKSIYAKQDIKLTMMPFFMKAMSLALNDFPIINSQVNDDCTELTYFVDHNIGMAVDTKIGLLVPNIKQVQLKSIIDMAKDVNRLTEQARSGRVASDDLKGGTITISNIGALGGTVATPIINKPEAAIVALGKVQKLPRFNEQGQVEARSIMQVSWSGDHRIIDGGTIAKFCNRWKFFLEQPSHMLVNLT